MSKRGAGEGSIYRRADGRWCASVSIGWSGGKRRRKYIYGSTRREVQTRLTTVLAGVERGLSADTDDRMTVGKWLTQWIEMPSKRRPTTVDRYRRAIRLHILPVLGNIKLRKLTPQDIQSYKRLKDSEGVTPAAMSVHLYCLSSAVQDAMRHDLVARNVVRLVGWVSVPRRPPVILTPTEARAFLAAASGHPYEYLFVVALALGTRIGETRGLRWSDVNFDQGFVTISQQVVQHDGVGLVATDVKTRSGRRTIHLPAVALEALQRQRALQQLQFDRAKRWVGGDYVFTSRVGTPINRQQIENALRTIASSAGLPLQRFHDLRHSCGSLLLAQGVPLRVISEMLGHSSITVTANVYLSVIPELQRSAAGKMDAILGSTVT